MLIEESDILVIGAGHAGCEAALTTARMGLTTTLATIDLSEVARAPCNLAISRPGESRLVREVDALRGEIVKNADWTVIEDLDYAKIRGLSSEGQEKLARVRATDPGSSGPVPGGLPGRPLALDDLS